jgi:pimeloyl-ACP methyl ester carboxylesterase
MLPTQERLIATLACSVEQGEVKAGSVTLPFISAGTGDPIVLLHGGNLGWASWYRNIAALAETGCVFAFDLPGAGSATPISLLRCDFRADLLEPLTSALRQLDLDKGVTVVGSSLGGWLALQLALDDDINVTRLVLTDAVGFLTKVPFQQKPIAIPAVAQALSKTVLRPSRSNRRVEAFLRSSFYDRKYAFAPEFIDYFYEMNARSPSVFIISRISRGAATELRLSDAELASLTMPTCVIWGVQDPIMPLRSVEDRIRKLPNVTLHGLGHVGHIPPIEASDTFNQLTTEFLAS